MQVKFRLRVEFTAHFLGNSWCFCGSPPRLARRIDTCHVAQRHSAALAYAWPWQARRSADMKTVLPCRRAPP